MPKASLATAEVLRRRERFFSLKLVYEGDALTGAVLDGRPLEVWGWRRSW